MNDDATKLKISRKRRAVPPELQAQLDALEGMPDTVSVPEAAAENWVDARRFYLVRRAPGAKRAGVC